MRTVISVLFIAGLALAFSSREAASVDQDVVLAISFDEAVARDLSPHGKPSA